MNAIHDEHKESPVTVIQADFVSTKKSKTLIPQRSTLTLLISSKENTFPIFIYSNFVSLQYYANELLPQKDEFIVTKVMSQLSRCIKDLENVAVVENEIKRFPKSLTHFFPGIFLRASY